MRCFNHSILFLLTTFVLLLLSFAVVGDLNSDRSTLLVFLSSLDGHSLLWKNSIPLCSWQDIVCESSRVTEIHMPGRSLFGTFLVGVIGNLSALTFNPHAGRTNTVDNNSLPILDFPQFSAQHVILYKRTVRDKGEGRVQVVRDEGNEVFNDVVPRGQILVVPKGFAVLLKTGRAGLEWVELKNNDNAVTNPITGKTPVLNAFPVEVLYV